MILVDSNVWIYLLDAGTSEHDRVRERLPSLLDDAELLLPAVVQMEVVHYVERALGPEEAQTVVADFLSTSGRVVPLDGGTVARAADLLLDAAPGIGGRDAALLVTCREHDARLATNDEALAAAAEATGLDTVNPAR